MRPAALLLASVPLVGCAYFNGIYNARQAQKRGDALLRDGRSAEAESLFTTAARKAETVLVHHPRSRWAGDAMFIAGWSWAMAARCDRAEPRLTSVLTRSEETDARLGRATLALGVCRVRERRFAAGRALLAPLARGADRQLARDASLWAALASVALGEGDSARVYLRTANPARADWELARAFLERGNAAAAESLLARRAAHGDYRDDLLGALRTLWGTGHADAVERIIARYDSSRAPVEDRARLHMLAGELSLAASADSAARAHFTAVARLSRDSTLLHDAAARLTLAGLRGLTTVVDVGNVIAAGHARAAGSALQRRLEDDLLLLQMLHDRDDDTGASLFLAAEVARDSLRAPALARALFGEVAALPRSALAVKALRAAAQLEPDSAAALRARADTLVAGAAFGELESASSTATAGDGTPATAPDDALLLRAWTRVAAQYADSLRRLHPASAPAATGSPAAPAAAAAPRVPPRPTSPPPAAP